ncbi:M48 family metalloprotease [Acidithiobacillus caldus]|uniref:M48 family metalloprotease n=1 Tax=Acidithiobacillus caldus TaxID=33059 RepID=UPI001C07C217|nr:M48 family metalloprotease [Acidithiobacillus caldus]MBU2770105.1 M48 family metalloprotease [Acidithiobacillus caldus]
METKPLPDSWLESIASVADALMCKPPPASIGPAWFMGPNAGMAMPSGHIWIHPKALSLPEDARRYLLAHEMGHILHGHSKAAFLAFASLLLLFPILPAVCATVGWGYLLALMIPNGLGDRAEYQADAVAMRILGSPYAVIRAQREIMARMGSTVTRQRERRWARLRAMSRVG